jgi:hypothetical protein
VRASEDGRQHQGRGEISAGGVRAASVVASGVALDRFPNREALEEKMNSVEQAAT